MRNPLSNKTIWTSPYASFSAHSSFLFIFRFSSRSSVFSLKPHLLQTLSHVSLPFLDFLLLFLFMPASTGSLPLFIWSFSLSPSSRPPLQLLFYSTASTTTMVWSHSCHTSHVGWLLKKLSPTPPNEMPSLSDLNEEWLKKKEKNIWFIMGFTNLVIFGRVHKCKEYEH